MEDDSGKCSSLFLYWGREKRKMKESKGFRDISEFLRIMMKRDSVENRSDSGKILPKSV